MKAAKDDGRLPMEDRNTRIVVFGKTTEQAKAVADAIKNEAFHNVSFFDGPFEKFRAVGADPSTSLGMTPAVIPSERSESRDLHSHPPNATQP